MLTLFSITTLTIIAIFIVTYLIVPIFGSPFLQSKKSDIQVILKISDIKKNMRIIDLGSGSATILAFMGKHGFTIDGVELNPFLVIYSKIKLWLLGLHGHIYMQNIFSIDLKEYDIVFCYLLPGLMENLSNKISNEMKPGSFIISNTFKFKNRKIYKQFGKIIIYKV